MMTTFRPRVGEEELDTGKAGIGQLSQHSLHISLNQAEIGKLSCYNPLKHGPNAWAVHLNANKIMLRLALSQSEQGAPRSKTHLQKTRRGTTKYLLYIQH
jgi:hypothetical protein